MPPTLSSKQLEQMVEITTRLVLQAGAYAKTQFGSARPQYKIQSIRGVRDVKQNLALRVGSVDYNCQHLILGGLADAGFNKDMDIGIVAEENTRDLELFSPNPDLRFVVDPLDGSGNYYAATPPTHEHDALSLTSDITIAHTSFFGISVGLQRNQDGFLFAIVYLPMFDALYVAVNKKGVKKNGETFQLDTQPKKIIKQLGKHRKEGSINRVVAPTTFDYRHRIGLNSKSDLVCPFFPRYVQPFCTVYGLTGIVDGRLQAYFARETFLHDFGPSALIVREAGGFVSNEDGNNLDCLLADARGKMPFVIAGPSKSYNHELISFLKDKNPALFER